jgi:NADPH-dependent glutamate synthase beta subunit-like oxidoreductase
VPVEGSEFEMEVDTLIPAIGQEPDLTFLSGNTQLKVSKWKTLEIDPETTATNVPGIFAGGDVVSGPATVLEAMAAGKTAAESIHRYLRGESLQKEYRPTEPRLNVPSVQLTEEEASGLERPEMPTLSVNERTGNFNEVDLGFTKELAMREAKRCLRCDLESKGGKR